MMYKIHYPEIPNMGDLLNKTMLEDLFGIQVQKTSIYQSNMSAIGSGLNTIQKSNAVKTRMKQVLNARQTVKCHYIWGSGFIENNDNNKSFIYPEIIVCSLRGKYSKTRMETILKKELDIPLGDGGLLADRWIGQVSKKYQVGVVPHFKEQTHYLLPSLIENYKNAVLINLRDDPKETVKKIAQCDFIISSSLHGLIIADSFGIPNMHLKLFSYGERMSGDGFKFRDYYSIYDLDDNPFDINRKEFPSINSIIDNYRIKKRDVESIKDTIFDAFPML